MSTIENEPTKPAAQTAEDPAASAPLASAPTPKASWLLHLAILIPLALGLFLFQLGQADWEDDSESCGGQIMQEMVSGHGWILPLRNGRHMPVKPPLFYWLGALSARARHSGVDLLDARLPSALLATLGLVIVYLYTRRVAGASVALWASLILVTTPQFIIEARNSRVDMAFCVLLTAALFLAHQVWEGEAGRRAAVLAGLCLGLAALSKGPLAFALAVLVMLPLAIVAPPFPTWRALLAPATLITAVVVPGLWYAAATVQQGWAFLRLHVYTENVGRLLGEQGHFPLWWYVEPLFTGGLPWTIALPAAVPMESAVPQRTRRFLWLWTVAMFVFFSLSPGKRRAYLVMVRPALAILLAGWLVPQLARLRQTPRPATVPRSVHVVIGLVIGVGLLCILGLRMGIGGFGTAETAWSHWWRQYLLEETRVAVTLVIGVAIGAELMARWISQRRFEWAAGAFVGTLALGLGIGISAGAIVRGSGASFRPFAERLATQVDVTQPLAFFDVDDETAIALLFHLRRHVAVVSPRDAEHSCEPPTAGLYLVGERAWEARACFRDERWHAIEHGGPLVQSQQWRRLVLARYDATRSVSDR